MKLRSFFAYIVGVSYGYASMLYYFIRYTLFPAQSDNILFVAHPDDDTLFFHNYIKENKPFVVCMTTAYSWRRLRGFKKTMKYYGVESVAFCNGNFDNHEEHLRRQIRWALRCGKFYKCCTHAKNGEYLTEGTNHGHEMHMRVHRLVAESTDLTLLTTVSPNEIINYPIAEKDYQDKSWIYHNYYYTELFCLDLFDDWMKNEKIITERE